jgi:hypothetical protein
LGIALTLVPLPVREKAGMRVNVVSPLRRVLCANHFAPLSRRLSLQEGKDKGVATLTASADSSMFLRLSAELALPLGRNRHLVNWPWQIGYE